ncbi:MAG: iron-sulfur cluster assembly protein IscA [Burkholderiales bacterium]|nr:iron-sulfur cluster assembly protein IscA [Burkholderiales bacterium]
MAITITEHASTRVAQFLKKRGRGLGIRLSITTRGCSGLAYKIEFVDSINLDDVIFESSGIKIIVDKKSLQYLDGTELDYAREGLQEGFKFTNPNAKDECGCGESFTV